MAAPHLQLWQHLDAALEQLHTVALAAVWSSAISNATGVDTGKRAAVGAASSHDESNGEHQIAVSTLRACELLAAPLAGEQHAPLWRASTIATLHRFGALVAHLCLAGHVG